ncbi:undecaprenyldiphospho-muramoylpentapeptide beta-N-acetylglucosaminyltransferase [soil metagenome]
MVVRVLLAGGGTAGHVSPLLATADAVRRIERDSAIICLGTERGPEVTLVAAAGFPLELVPAIPMPRSFSTDLVRLPGRVRAAVSAAVEILDRIRPHVVVGFGCYVAVPAYLAARRRRVPLVVHEGNALPGLANRLGSRLTSNVATSFPATVLPHATCTGLPIRRLISGMDRSALRSAARAEFGLDEHRPTLLVTGGSQGARRLNEAVGGAASALAHSGVQVLHVTGRTNEVAVQRSPEDPPYGVVPFLTRIDLAYAAADLVICRAGANTVTEVAVVGLPAVFVPLPIGNGEQALNAAPVVEAGGGLLVEDVSMTAAWVASQVPGLVHDRDRLAAMSAVAATLLPRSADVAVARMALRAAGEAT